VIDPSTPLGSVALELSLRRILTDPLIDFRTPSSVVEPPSDSPPSRKRHPSSDRV
jgi:hypothetical protein